VVPVPAGGLSDTQARIIARKLADSTGQVVLVENKPGGSTLIASREVAAAAPDGHTLLCTFQILVMLPHLFRDAPYDYARSFTPVTRVSSSGLVLATHSSVPVENLRELIAYAKARPGQLSFGSSGAGTISHVDGELLMRLAGVRMVHVPYKGSGDLIRDLLAGRVQLSFEVTPTVLPGVKGGRLRMLGAATTRRLPALPDLPTLREQGIDIAFDSWLGFFGPGGMPPAVVDALYGHFAHAVQDPEVREAFALGGAEAGTLPTAEFARLAQRQYERWGELLRELDIRLD
jgi:tripartite-type tricarboxylate transporter receptor subunit TctC